MISIIKAEEMARVCAINESSVQERVKIWQEKGLVEKPDYYQQARTLELVTYSNGLISPDRVNQKIELYEKAYENKKIEIDPELIDWLKTTLDSHGYLVKNSKADRIIKILEANK